MGFRVQGVRVQGAGFRVQGEGFRLRVQGTGFRVQGLHLMIVQRLVLGLQAYGIF